MDYHQKMIVRPTQNYKPKDNDNDDDDEDLEALRLAALMSLKAKSTSSKISQPQNSFLPPTNSFPVYNSNANIINNNKNHGNHRRRDFYPNRTLIRQNGTQNAYHPSRNNQNLIEIIPVDENAPKNDTGVEASVPVTENEDSKFQRFNDNASGSEDEDPKPKDTIEEQPTSGLTELSEISEAQKEVDEPTDEEVGEISESVEVAENSPKENLTNEDDEDEENDKDEEEEEDDDDVLLMADLEEEDSLERLMDEMEREMADKPLEKKEKKSRRESKSLKKDHDKSHKRSDKIDAQSFPTSTSTSTALASGSASASFPSTVSYKNDRPVSPYERTRHRSVSPKVKRKKSPRRSPPRLKKSRDIRQRSPRPPRHTPPRSPKKLSPRRRSRSRSPRNIRSRLSPPRRSKSPGRSPRPRSPFIRSSRSPRLSPRRLSPRRLSPRKQSPRRPSPRLDRGHSPHCSPIHSPWSSPRNSPRLSPKRRRSPPSVASTVTSNANLHKDKKPRRSKTPEDFNSYKRENSPDVRSKIKTTAKEINELNDPVLEARRRKFESTKLIDPINDNKKIKLSRKVDDADEEVVDSLKRKADQLEDIEDGEDEEGLIDEDGNDEERDLEGEEGEIVGDGHGHNRDDVNENEGNEDEEEGLCLNESFDLDELAEHVSDETVASQMIFEPVKKLEKSRTKKKKKKDKEIYQVGKLKSGELPLSERLGKEKKCKKRKEYVENVGKEVEEDVNSPEEVIDEEADLRTELSRRRAERLNRNAPIQSARLLQSAFKGVVNEVAKNNSKVLQRQLIKEEKHPQKEIRRVTVLHRSIPELHDSEDEIIDSKVPIKFRLGLNKVQETRESKVSRKSSKRQSRKMRQS